MRRRRAETEDAAPETSAPSSDAGDSVGFYVYSFTVFVAAIYGCYDMNVLRVCLAEPRVNRALFDLNLLLIGALLMCKFYLEIFRVGIKGETVTYESARTTTHVMLWLMLASSLL